MKLTMRWSREHQWMEADGERYEHRNQPKTTPSHDLCHLIVAAHGDPALPWRPGPRPETPVAEFNAVQVQRLYIASYAFLMQGRPLGDWLLVQSQWESHADWYVHDHSQKFNIVYPISLAESCRRFLAAVDAELVTRLWPIYVDVYGAERASLDAPINLSFTERARPKTDARGERGRELIATVIQALHDDCRILSYPSSVTPAGQTSSSEGTCGAK